VQSCIYLVRISDVNNNYYREIKMHKSKSRSTFCLMANKVEQWQQFLK
jgi:hypothetical protein